MENKEWVRLKQFIIEMLKMEPNRKLRLDQLGKAFYYANVFSLRKLGKFISLHAIVKLPWGPAIDNYRDLYSEMEENGYIDQKGHYICLKKSFPNFAKFDEDEILCIRDAFNQIKNKTFNQLSKESHRLKSYQEAMACEDIDIFNDILSKDEINRIADLAKSIPHFP